MRFYFFMIQLKFCTKNAAKMPQGEGGIGGYECRRFPEAVVCDVVSGQHPLSERRPLPRRGGFCLFSQETQGTHLSSRARGAALLRPWSWWW